MRFFDPLPIPNADAAQLIRCFPFFREEHGGSSLTQFFTRTWERQPTARYFDRNGIVPAWYHATIDGNTIVLIDGVSTLEQSRLIMSAYTGNIQSGFNSPDNHVFTNCAADILLWMERLSLFQGDNLTIVGWSLGGAIAARLNTLRMATRGNDATIRVISYGAPRLGSESLARMAVQGQTCTRYMAFDDPIPNYPPRSGNFTWLPFVVGVRASLRYGNFVHHAGGICIDADGGFIDRATPTEGAITPTVALDVLWHGLAADSLSAHSVGHYSRLLELQARHVPTPVPSAVRHTEHTQEAQPAVLHQQERHTFSAVRELQQTQESQQVQIPRERLAQARRIGRAWYVVWNETAIMMTPTRRRAQGLARELNAFLRRMQSTAYVSPDSLEQQMRIFLQLAADDQSDIRPTLSTEIPLP